MDGMQTVPFHAVPSLSAQHNSRQMSKHDLRGRSSCITFRHSATGLMNTNRNDRTRLLKEMK